MFARTVTVRLKANMKADFQRTLENEIVPLLRKRQGFQDELTLVSQDGTEAVGISLWDSKQNAESYQRETYPEVQKILGKVIDGTPQVNPTWVRFDGEYLWLTATTSRRKHRNWQIQPAVALSITDPDRPWRYLEIRGQVELIVPDPEGAEFVRLAERYGMPQGPPADAAERIAVAVLPLHTTTQ